MSKAKDKEFISEVKRVLGLPINCADVDVFVKIGELKHRASTYSRPENVILTDDSIPLEFGVDHAKE